MFDKTRVVMITTIDNPFNPLEDYDDWLLYDISHNYNTCGLLSRYADVTDDMIEPEVNKEIERAIDEIITNDFLGIYKKVTNK